MSIFTIIILLIIFSRIKSDARVSDFGKVIATIFAISVLLRIFGGTFSIFSAIAALFGILATMAIPLGIVLFLIYKYVIKQDTDKNTKKYGWNEETKEKMKDREKNHKNTYENPAPLKSKILPKPVVKRKKIIASFDQKYNLNLTEEQIKRIADASYLSFAWKQEVEAMVTKYDAVYQWFQGNTAYLRAYLYVFPVQDVTSDFTQQQQICLDSFEEVFAYADSFRELNIDEKIEMINRKYFTNFDEVTYMIAFRFLEANGYHHKMDKVSLNCNEDNIDDLLKKYQQAESEV